MARYIDADKFTERIKVSPAFCNINDGLLLQRVVIDLLNNAPTAEVVPKSEVEALQGALKAEERHNELTMKMAQKALKNARSELASEIFAEIEKYFDNDGLSVLMLREEFYELKKKYTEGKK